MHTIRKYLAVSFFVAIVVQTLAPVSAYAWHDRGRIWIGPGWGWGPYPYRYYSPYAEEPPVIVQQQPDVIIQAAPQQQAPPPEQAYWYYCLEKQTYYPYVTECPSGWMKVVPTPPPSSGKPR